jgi:hypothetical protein
MLYGCLSVALLVCARFLAGTTLECGPSFREACCLRSLRPCRSSIRPLELRWQQRRVSHATTTGNIHCLAVRWVALLLRLLAAEAAQCCFHLILHILASDCAYRTKCSKPAECAMLACAARSYAACCSGFLVQSVLCWHCVCRSF